MPLSQLDPVAALVVIDMQKGIVSLPTVHPMAGVTDNVAKLCKAFRARMLPVILVNVTGRAPGRVEATFKLDAAILGGVVVRIGSTVYDGSVLGRVERLKEELTR